MNSNTIDIYSKQFTDEIKKLAPCHRYWEYLRDNALRKNMTLLEIMYVGNIPDMDKEWLLEEMYQVILRRNVVIFDGKFFARGIFGEHRSNVTYEDHVNFLEYAYDLKEKMEGED